MDKCKLSLYAVFVYVCHFMNTIEKKTDNENQKKEDEKEKGKKRQTCHRSLNYSSKHFFPVPFFSAEVCLNDLK